MHRNWIAFFVIWAVVEFILFLGKQPFPKRMLNGAVWAVFLLSMIQLGEASKNANTFGFLAVALVLNGLVAAIVCGLRMFLAGLWKRLVLRKTESEPLVAQPGAIATLGSILGVWLKWLGVFIALSLVASAIFAAAVWKQ